MNAPFDTLAAGCGYVLIVGSKTQLNVDAVSSFASRLPDGKEYLPEFVAHSDCFVAGQRLPHV